MRERFIKIGEAIGKKVEVFVNGLIGLPPSYLEAVESFKHDKGCSGTKALQKIVSTQFISLGDPGVWRGNVPDIPVDINFLECPECHSSVRYSNH